MPSQRRDRKEWSATAGVRDVRRDSAQWSTRQTPMKNSILLMSVMSLLVATSVANAADHTLTGVALVA